MLLFFQTGSSSSSVIFPTVFHVKLKFALSETVWNQIFPIFLETSIICCFNTLLFLIFLHINFLDTKCCMIVGKVFSYYFFRTLASYTTSSFVFVATSIYRLATYMKVFVFFPYFLFLRLLASYTDRPRSYIAINIFFSCIAVFVVLSDIAMV